MSDSPMRQAGKAGTAVLERLAASAPSNALPRQATMLAASEREERISRALGTISLQSTALVWAAVLDLFLLSGLVSAADAPDMTVGVVVTILVIGVVVTWIAATRNANVKAQRQAVEAKALAWPTQQPFPVEGYREWLASDRPLLDVHPSAVLDAALLERAVQAIDAAITVEVLDERVARLAIPPIVASRGKAGSVKYGNVPLLQRVFTELVLPLHNDAGVERVEMGGLIEERPA